MFEFILPLILNLLLILYCITNLKTKYNIVYIVWLVFSIIPLINWAAIISVPVFISFGMDDFYKRSTFEFKPTKLNKFLFGYEERED
jgi:hypothetical protein